MGKSYKKTPVCKDNNRYSKRQSSKAVRKAKEIGSGSNYKKVYQSYNIHDFVSYNSFSEYKRARRKFGFKESEEKMLRDWLRYYVRK